MPKYCCKPIEELYTYNEDLSIMKNGNFGIFFHNCWWDIGWCPFCGTELKDGNYHDYINYYEE